MGKKKKIIYVEEDDLYTPEEALTIFKRLIERLKKGEINREDFEKAVRTVLAFTQLKGQILPLTLDEFLSLETDKMEMIITCAKISFQPPSYIV
jgi:hypothetical protein